MKHKGTKTTKNETVPAQKVVYRPFPEDAAASNIATASGSRSRAPGLFSRAQMFQVPLDEPFRSLEVASLQSVVERLPQFRLERRRVEDERFALGVSGCFFFVVFVSLCFNRSW